MNTFVAALTAGLLLPVGTLPADTAAKKTLGFVVVSWRTAQYETKYFEECPEGLAIGNDEIWWKSLPPRDRDRLTNGGLIEPVDIPRRGHLRFARSEQRRRLLEPGNR